MEEQEVLNLLYNYFCSLFPMKCNACGRVFDSLRDYIQVTDPVGPSVSYDAERGDWQTERPLGSFALANCPCGSTLSLTTEGLEPQDRKALLLWLKSQSESRHQTPSEVLGDVRRYVRERATSTD